MRLLAWNCRGLGNPGTVHVLKGLIASQGPDVVFISETKKSSQEMCSMRRSLGLSNLFPLDCAGTGRSRAGGLCLLWNDEVEVDIVHASPNHILCMVTHPLSQDPMQVLGIYGFPDEQNKHRTWEMIDRFKPHNPATPWVCLGDFNDILSPDDKRGGGQVDILRLQNNNQTLSACGLVDAGFNGFRFTWSNKRQEPHTIQERLDYALVNEGWRKLWPVVEVSHLARHKSDHNPILMACYPHPRGEKQRRIHRFRFEEVWLDKVEDCTAIVTVAWSAVDAGIGQKIADLGSALDSWGREIFGDIPKKVAMRRDRLQALQSMDQSERVLEEAREIERELDTLLEQEEVVWAQSSSNPVDIQEATRLVEGRVSPVMLNILNAPFTREDVEEALFQMHPNKAPGIDGLPALFYQKFWHIVGDDVVNFCLQVLSGQMSPGMINQTLIVLIPKVKKPLHANQFRPISLCNVLFKIITKVIANRLKLVLPDIICGPQSAFVPGRLITDNALIAYECFHFMKKKCSGRNGHMALKLDMSKAYDRVEWPFLCSVLVHMGFPANWVKLIMECVTTVRFQVMLNGNPQMPFDPGRGLRQGDPLSPYLFILCGEVFSALIQRELVGSSLSGIKIARSAPVINFDKSMLSCSRNVPSPRFDELKRLLGVKAVDSYDKYLGLPTIIDIERMISKFYWSGDASRRSIHWLKWDTLCRPKYDGGVGFRDFKAFNTALVGKNWWRLYRSPESLLGRLFKAVYYPNGSICAAKKGSRPSYAWSSIFCTRWVFEEGARWKVGDGQSIDIWRDKWVPNDAPLIHREDLAQSANLGCVSQLFIPGQRAWDKDLVEMVFWPPTTKAILQIPLSLAGGDELFWLGSTDGLYTTKQGYMFIRERKIARTTSSSLVQAHSSFWKKLWKVPALPRCLELVWRAVKGILPVRKLLRGRGIDIEEACPFCNDAAESIDHVLLSCPIVARWWFVIMRGLRIPEGSSVCGFMQHVFQLDDPSIAADCVVFLSVLWEARNRCVFQGQVPQLQDLMARTSLLTAPPRGSPTTVPRALPDAWSRPSGDEVKINCDGSWVKDKPAGLGCVARNAQGLVMAAATAFPVEAPSPLVAEALAFRWCLSLASDLFFQNIVVETDCLQLYDAWYKSMHGASYLISILKDCKDLVSSFRRFRLMFVRRSGNTVANHLAKNSSQYPNCVWIEEVPPDCVGLIASDVTSSMTAYFFNKVFHVQKKKL
ncbi:uncharacterized protein LOC130713437 [Lotus japonicus]|uniref:uncharacterized protein LOC130713437 n=1 Tax=Lotus japonicus TaxID=34305 RepID=UPI00258C01E6|nr:uncharacterized protein LOC130713437 [Lotus japonicus]